MYSVSIICVRSIFKCPQVCSTYQGRVFAKLSSRVFKQDSKTFLNVIRPSQAYNVQCSSMQVSVVIMKCIFQLLIKYDKVVSLGYRSQFPYQLAQQGFASNHSLIDAKHVIIAIIIA